MDDTNKPLACLNCARSEYEIPLVSLRYAGNQAWICSQCLPVLIHHSDRLTSKLGRVARGGPSQGSLDYSGGVGQP